MAGETAMNRLLQGDVGSGKTLVAAAAIWACIRAGYQAALLAPTEILAAQHAEGLNRLLAPFGMRVALLTGGMKAAARRTTLAAIRKDEADLVVGTHALMSEGVGVCPAGSGGHRRAAPLWGASARHIGRKGREPAPAGHERHPYPPHAGAADLRRLRISPFWTSCPPGAPRSRPGASPANGGETCTAFWTARSTKGGRCIWSAPPSRMCRTAD